MPLRDRASSWSVSGMRTRFFPRSRIGHGLVAMAPWLDMVLLIILFALLEKRVVVQPGLVVGLPRAPFDRGTRVGFVAVILSGGNVRTGGRREIVFFDDQRFLVREPEQMDALRQAMAASAEKHPGAPLVLEADEAVAHGTVVNVVNMARQVGIREVNVAVRPK